MSRFPMPALTRRAFLASAAASTADAMLPVLWRSPVHAAAPQEVQLRAAPDRMRLMPGPSGEIAAWCYGGTVPGPEIRVRQGERLRVVVENALAEETTVHWHGVRVPHAMDGVPHLSQKPIGAGERFVYEFDAVDAGTFWYHPHQRSFEQVERGLYGPLIIEEREPARVDRDVTWVLDDWRLTKSGAISEDFGNRHDIHHNGRVGNTVTINGRVPTTFAVRAGERIRLRLINAANARIFSPDFTGLQPIVIALDGQPVAPHAPDGGLVVLGPAMRADLILDMTGKPGRRVSIFDRFYEGLEYKLVDIAYSDTPLRERAPDWPLALPANPLPEPDLETASRNEVVFTGGMMGQMVAQDMGESIGPGAGRHGARHEFDDGRREDDADHELQHRLVHQWHRRRPGSPRHETGADACAEQEPCHRNDQCDSLASSDPSARPFIPGDFPQWPAHPSSRMAGHGAGFAARKGRDRLRRRQPR